MLKKLFTWYGKKPVIIVGAIIAVLIIGAVVVSIQQKGAETAEVDALPLVKVASVSNISSTDTVSLIGTVRAVSEAQIESEAAGRITRVNVKIGDTVSAGQIIAQQENAAQAAAVLQAEGAYEAALAAAQQSDVSVESAESAVTSAENTLISSYKSAYTTVSDAMLTAIDDFFTNPNSSLPGLRIDGQGNTQTLNSERIAFQLILSDWQENTVSISRNSNLDSLSDEAQSDIGRLISMIDIFVTIVNDQDPSTMVNGTPVQSYSSTLLAKRSALNAALASLQSADSALVSAEENLTKAQLGGTDTTLSTANAQVKQALGSLRAAQANYSKTVFRSSIGGTVNSLSVNVGDYVGAFSPIAKIANNNALEISTFVGESDLARIAVGDEVTIENKYKGIVTNVAAGIDSTTQKSEVKIATETSELTNGATVSIALEGGTTAKPSDKILLPITAIKFNAENGSVFTVEDNILVMHDVTIGVIRGSFVEVLEGVTADMEIVVDARGLSAGGKVDVTQ